MEVLNYFENHSLWTELTEKPEQILSFSYGMTEDISSVFTTLHLLNREAIVFIEVPVSIFFRFQEEWETLHANKP